MLASHSLVGGDNARLGALLGRVRMAGRYGSIYGDTIKKKWMDGYRVFGVYIRMAPRS